MNGKYEKEKKMWLQMVERVVKNVVFKSQEISKQNSVLELILTIIGYLHY